jgi:hypothetical protein
MTGQRWEGLRAEQGPAGAAAHGRAGRAPEDPPLAAERGAIAAAGRPTVGMLTCDRDAELWAGRKVAGSLPGGHQDVSSKGHPHAAGFPCRRA